MGLVAVFSGSPESIAAAQALLAQAELAGDPAAPTRADRLAAAVLARVPLTGLALADTALAFHRRAGVAFGPEAGPPGDLRFEMLRSLSPARTAEQGGIAVAGHAATGLAGVLATSAGEALAAAEALAGAFPRAPVAAGAAGAAEALAGPARLAQGLKAKGRIAGAVLSLKGHGRVTGPLAPDRLIRFGVSAWR